MDPAPPTDVAAGTRRFAFLLALAAFLLVFGLRWLYVPFALGPDEGDYATATMQAMRGESLYSGQRSARPPLLYVYYESFARVSAGTGQPIDVTVHALAALLAAAAVGLLAFALGRRLGRLPAAFGALLAVALAASPGLQAVDGNAETLMLLPYTAAGLLMWHWARGERIARPWLEGAMAGLLAVVAIMTKQVAGVLVVQLAVALVLRRRDVVALAGSFAAAAGAGVLAAAGWAASTDQLREWIVYGWLQNFMYAQNAAGPQRLRVALDGIWRLRAIILAPLLLTGVAVAWPRHGLQPSRRADTWFALGWLLLSAVPTTISAFFFPHYFIQLIPAMALMAAIAAERFLTWRDNAGRTRIATAAVVLFLAATLAGPGVSLARAYGVYPQLPIPTNSNLKPEVGAWVRSLTKPTDRVVMWSELRGLSVYAERLPANAVPEASLYTMRAFTIYGRNAGTTVLGVPLTEPMDLIIAQWQARPPDAVLVTTKSGRTLEDLARESGLRDDAALVVLLRDFKVVERRTFDGLDAVVYRRR